MAQDLRAKDQAAADRIDFLDDHCSNLEAELIDVMRERDAAIDQVRRMKQDRECVD